MLKINEKSVEIMKTIHPRLYKGYPGLTPVTLMGVVRVKSSLSVLNKVILKVKSSNFIQILTKTPILAEQDPLVYELNQELILFDTKNSVDYLLTTQSNEETQDGKKETSMKSVMDFEFQMELKEYDPYLKKEYSPEYSSSKWHHGPFQYVTMEAEASFEKDYTTFYQGSTKRAVLNVKIQPYNRALLGSILLYLNPQKSLSLIGYLQREWGVSKKKDYGFTWESISSPEKKKGKNSSVICSPFAEWKIQISRVSFIPGMAFTFTWQIRPIAHYKVFKIKLSIHEVVSIGTMDLLREDDLANVNLSLSNETEIVSFEKIESINGEFWRSNHTEITIPNQTNSFLNSQTASGCWGKSNREPSLKVAHKCKITITFKNADTPVVLECPVGFIMMDKDELMSLLSEKEFFAEILNGQNRSDPVEEIIPTYTALPVECIAEATPIQELVSENVKDENMTVDNWIDFMARRQYCPKTASAFEFTTLPIKI